MVDLHTHNRPVADFSVTIPDVTEQCSEAGACAIQWWWYGTKNDQTYESCIDFVIG